MRDAAPIPDREAAELLLYVSPHNRPMPSPPSGQVSPTLMPMASPKTGAKGHSLGKELTLLYSHTLTFICLLRRIAGWASLPKRYGGEEAWKAY